MKYPNRCNHCGRFISYKDFREGLAKSRNGYEMDGSEYYDAWYVVCQERYEKKINEHNKENL